jgi:factor associated with neutral sphingomyelinase activation
VSQNINGWIDLIYGYKQRGKEAIEHMNIFYPLTYEHCIDLEKVTDPDERMSFETQIAHFGQNPSQIIGSNPHPTRRTLKLHWEEKLVADGGELLIQKCFLSKAPLK